MNKNYLFYSDSKKLNHQKFVTKTSYTDFSSFRNFSFSINGSFAVYENQLLTWIPQTQNLYDDNLEYLSYPPLSFSNFGIKKITKIACNTDVCHAITEEGVVFSWGNDSQRKGLLALGEGVFTIKTPKYNNFLSSVRIKDISLSETHGCAVDKMRNVYTWGDGSCGQLGSVIKGVCMKPKKVVLDNNNSVNGVNRSFQAVQVECGKDYTAGVNEKGNAFWFGKVVNGVNSNNTNDKGDKQSCITFLYLDDNNKAEKVYCGDYMMAITSQKGDVYLFSHVQGLFKVKLNPICNNGNNSNNSIYSSSNSNNISLVNPISFFGSSNTINITAIKFIDKTFYALDTHMHVLYEFINYTPYSSSSSSHTKQFDVFNYIENQYTISYKYGLNMLSMPYYVKALFFTMHCSLDDKDKFESCDKKLFNKVQYKHRSANADNVSVITESKIAESNYTGFGSNVTSGSSRVNRISTMLGNIFEKKIESIVNNNKVGYEKNKNTFFYGKKRIELIPIDYNSNSNDYQYECNNNTERMRLMPNYKGGSNRNDYYDNDNNDNEYECNNNINRNEGKIFLHNESLEEINEEDDASFSGRKAYDDIVTSNNMKQDNKEMFKGIIMGNVGNSNNIIDNFPLKEFSKVKGSYNNDDNMLMRYNNVNNNESDVNNKKRASQLLGDGNIFTKDKDVHEKNRAKSSSKVNTFKSNLRTNNTHDNDNDDNNITSNIKKLKSISKRRDSKHKQEEQQQQQDEINMKINALIQKNKESNKNIISINNAKEDVNNSNSNNVDNKESVKHKKRSSNKLLEKVKDEIEMQKAMNKEDEIKQERYESERNRNVESIHNNINNIKPVLNRNDKGNEVEKELFYEENGTIKHNNNINSSNSNNVFQSGNERNNKIKGSKNNSIIKEEDEEDYNTSIMNKTGNKSERNNYNDNKVGSINNNNNNVKDKENNKEETNDYAKDDNHNTKNVIDKEHKENKLDSSGTNNINKNIEHDEGNKVSNEYNNMLRTHKDDDKINNEVVNKAEDIDNINYGNNHVNLNINSNVENVTNNNNIKNDNYKNNNEHIQEKEEGVTFNNINNDNDENNNENIPVKEETNKNDIWSRLEQKQMQINNEGKFNLTNEINNNGFNEDGTTSNNTNNMINGNNNNNNDAIKINGNIISSQTNIIPSSNGNMFDITNTNTSQNKDININNNNYENIPNNEIELLNKQNKIINHTENNDIINTSSKDLHNVCSNNYNNMSHQEHSNSNEKEINPDNKQFNENKEISQDSKIKNDTLINDANHINNSIPSSIITNKETNNDNNNNNVIESNSNNHNNINLLEKETKKNNNIDNNKNNDINNTHSTNKNPSQVKDLLHFNNENIIIEETTSINKDIPLYQGNSNNNTSNRHENNHQINQNVSEIPFTNDNKENNRYTHSKEDESHKQEYNYNNNNSEQFVSDNNALNENLKDNYISPSIKENSNVISQPETINTQLFSNKKGYYDNNNNSQQIIFNEENQVNNKDEVVSQKEQNLNNNHNNNNKNNDNISLNEAPHFEISNGTSSNDFQISNGNDKMTIHDHELLHTTNNNNEDTISIDKTSHSINNNNNNNINLNKPSTSSLVNQNQQISSNNIILNGEEHNHQTLNNTNTVATSSLNNNNNYIGNDTIHSNNLNTTNNEKALEQQHNEHTVSPIHNNNNNNPISNSTPNSENNRYIISNKDKDNNIISNPINTESSSEIYGLPLQMPSLNNNNLKQYTKHQTITNSAMKSRIYRDLSNHNSYSIDNQNIPITTTTNNENGIAQPHKHNASTINIPSETANINNDTITTTTNNNNNINNNNTFTNKQQSSLLRPNIIRKLEKKNEIIQKQKQKQNYSMGGISDNISSPEKPVMLLPQSIKNIKVKDENTQTQLTNNDNNNNNNDDTNNINFPLKKRNSIKRINIKDNDKSLNMPFTPSTVNHSHLNNQQPSQTSTTHNLQIKPSPYLPPSQLPTDNDVPLTTNDLVTSPQTQTQHHPNSTMKFAIVKGTPSSSTNNNIPLNDNNTNINNSNNNNNVISSDEDDNDDEGNDNNKQCNNTNTKVLLQHKHSSNSKRIPLTPNNDNDIESSDNDESAEEKVIAFDDDKITKTRKVKEKAKQHQQQLNNNNNNSNSNTDSLILEQPTSISHHPNSKHYHHRHKSNPNNNISSTPSQSMITSSNAMKHIHKIDTSTSTKKFEFEPKELDDNMITSINNSKQQQQQQPSHMLSSSVIGKTDPFTYNDDNITNINSNNNNKLRLDDLQTEKRNVNDVNVVDNNDKKKKRPKVIKVKTKEELVKLLKETNELEDSDTSVYYYIEENGDNLTDIQEEEDDLLDSQSNRNRNSQIVKVKNRKVISVSMNTGSKYAYVDNNSNNVIGNNEMHKNVSDNEMNNSLSEILKNQNENYIDELTQENEMNISNNGVLNKDNLNNNNNNNDDDGDVNESNEMSFNSKTLPQFYNRKSGNATIERDHEGNIIDNDCNIPSLTTTGFVKMKSHKLFGTANKNKQTQPTYITNNALTTNKKGKQKVHNTKGNSGVNSNSNNNTPVPKTVSQVRNVNYNKFVKSNTITSSPSKKRGESPMVNANNTNWNKQFNKQKSIHSTGSGNNNGNTTTTNTNPYTKGIIAITKTKNINPTNNIKPKQSITVSNVISQIKHQHKSQTPINPTLTSPQNLNNSFNTTTSPQEPLQTPLTQQDTHYFHTQTAFHPKQQQQQSRYTPTPSSSHSKPPKFNQTQVNTINYLNKQIPSTHSSNYKTPSFKTAVSPSKPLKQNNLSKELTRCARKQQKDDELSYSFLKQKYTEYIQEQASKGKNVNITSEEQAKDETFLQELAVGEIKSNTMYTKGNNNNISDINSMNVSNVMKEFIIQSVENFKLNQVKERISYQMGNKVDNSNSIVPTRSNLFGLIQLDYEDENENENKERSNMLEPIELDKSWISILRSSFISK